MGAMGRLTRNVVISTFVGSTPFPTGLGVAMMLSTRNGGPPTAQTSYTGLIVLNICKPAASSAMPEHNDRCIA